MGLPSGLSPRFTNTDKDLYVVVLYERGKPPVDFVLLAENSDDTLSQTLTCFSIVFHRSLEELRATCKYEVIPLTASGFLVINHVTQLKSNNPEWIGLLETVSEQQEEGAVCSQQEDCYVGDVSVELTGLAIMRQRRVLHLTEPLPASSVEALAKQTAGDHEWNYQDMRDETVEVTILS